MKQLHIAAFVVGVFVLGIASANAQTVVVLKMSAGTAAFGAPEAGYVALRLASGTIIYVPLGDLDLDATRRLAGMLPAPPLPSSRAPAAPPATASPSLQPALTVPQFCQKEWPTDFRMQTYCQSIQMQARTALTLRDMRVGDRATIRTGCKADWPNDFRMQNYCEEQQLTALATLGR
jgi:hypothetical protein